MTVDVFEKILEGLDILGNGLLLPAGPLREGQWRLEHVDLIITNGDPQADECSMKIRRGELTSLGSQGNQSLADFSGQQVHAVAGIGNPERFFSLLRSNGLMIIEHRFDDHHDFKQTDVDFKDGLPVIMTEKDAVKCQRFAGNGYWYLEVSAQPDARFVQGFYELLEEVKDGQKAA